MAPDGSFIDVGNVAVLFRLASAFSSVTSRRSDPSVSSQDMKEHSSFHTHKQKHTRTLPFFLCVLLKTSEFLLLVLLNHNSVSDPFREIVR